MNQVANNPLLIYILVFCRLGSSLILLPGLANARLPLVARLLFAFACTLALVPFLAKQVQAADVLDNPVGFRAAVISECLVGLAFGFWCLLYLQASRFAGSTIASAVGLAGIPGQPIDDKDPTSHLATLLSLATTALIFATDIHLVSLRAVLETYNAMPITSIPSGKWFAENSMEVMRDTSIIALQMASPFVVLVVVTNLSLGLCAKFTPQLQVYFASLGLTILASLVLLAWLSPGLLRIPVSAYLSWLEASSQ